MTCPICQTPLREENGAEVCATGKHRWAVTKPKPPAPVDSKMRAAGEEREA